MPEDFKHAIDAVKLRIPIEELVRERVAGLKKAGALWVACCPFHEERTPSFKVDPRRGTWRCYGACGTGGDVIRFLERHDNLSFMEALEILATRAGVELPRTRKRSAEELEEHAALYEVLARATDFYRRTLHRPEGAIARTYLADRGLTPTTAEAFGVGLSPAGGEVLLSRAKESGLSLDALLATGLVRRSDDGRAYDFFRGRLMVPIRDLEGRTVGFGARRLIDGDPRVPKYVNTPETPLFHKGQLVYALDLAMPYVRKSGHLILVEGYTDVMAAHQAGVRHVAAVLGTATTEDHAALIRRSGARRVTLCFDGDAAGGQATYRALAGLLGLEIELDVVRLDRALAAERQGGADIKDPCDLFVRRGAEAFERVLAQAANWFDFVVDGLLALPVKDRWAAVDRALELIGRLRKPVQRDGRLAQLATALGHPVEAVRQQFESLPGRLREARRAEEERARSASEAPERGRGRSGEPASSRSRAWRDIVGAILREPALFGRIQAYVPLCDDGALRELLDAQGRLDAAGLPGGVEALSSALGETRSCDLLYSLLSEAESAESAEILLDGALARIARELQEERVRELRAELSHASEAEQTRILAEIFAIRESNTPARGTPARAPSVLPAEHATSPGITHV